MVWGYHLAENFLNGPFKVNFLTAQPRALFFFEICRYWRRSFKGVVPYQAPKQAQFNKYIFKVMSTK